jgi:hypothetical protein
MMAATNHTDIEGAGRERRRDGIEMSYMRQIA